MLACVDVAYAEDTFAAAACLLFRTWADARETAALTARIDAVVPYQPGEFFRRELPCLLAVLAQVHEPLEVVVVDGHAFLPGGRPGLGARLFEALGGRVVVVGVAKTGFHGDMPAERVLRGTSTKPLFVSAAGETPARAADWIRAMHGAHRIPTLLGRVDRLCRDALRVS